ncbi:MAG: hypothetical protein KJ626_03120 [Verrucomicrobia bacterium]|nr:hypothetical protein [Verrucomicrobiota bacterium]MBU1694620.1 hypothetical protein [Verrucomicrobiota bacterium]
MNEKTKEALRRACEAAADIQDELLESAKNTAKTDEPTAWQDAEALFQLAKEADEFRRRLAHRLGNVSAPAAVEHTRLVAPGPSSRRADAGTERTAPKKRKAEYPRYLVADNCLVKIGLQRNHRAEYQHVVPKAAVDKVFSVVANLLTKAKDFTPESVQANLNIPAYQTYVVLAMLRSAGVLRTPRRGSYTATNAGDFTTAASGTWSKLPTSEGHLNDNE